MPEQPTQYRKFRRLLDGAKRVFGLVLLALETLKRLRDML